MKHELILGVLDTGDERAAKRGRESLFIGKQMEWGG
jgi:hypothetical protein